MIQLPKSTFYGKRMPKEKFYSHLDVSAAIKRSFVDDIDYFVWRNKLSASTVNIAEGVIVKEIALFEVILKKEDYNPDIFELIDKNILYLWFIFLGLIDILLHTQGLNLDAKKRKETQFNKQIAILAEIKKLKLML